MKRFVFGIIGVIAVLSMLFAFSGCAAEEEPPDIDKDDLIGRWTRMIGGTDSETYAFFGNGKCSKTFSTSDGAKTTDYGTFEVSGNMLNITFTDTKKTEEHKVTFKKEKTKMVWDKDTGLSEFMKE